LPKAERTGNTIIIRKEASDENINDKIKKIKNKDKDIAEALEKILERLTIIEQQKAGLGQLFKPEIAQTKIKGRGKKK
jgi:hypothetical protein